MSKNTKMKHHSWTKKVGLLLLLLLLPQASIQYVCAFVPIGSQDGREIMADWFERLAGFSEDAMSYEEIQEQFIVEHEPSSHRRRPPSAAATSQHTDSWPTTSTILTSKVNGRRMVAGRFESVSLAQLRERVDEIITSRGTGTSTSPFAANTVREYVGDIRTILNDQFNAGSMIQVASQFNCLEMIEPRVTPEMGIGIYENDRTQGPICAMACGAGTIYRNYFAEVSKGGDGGGVGQTADRQLDGLYRLGLELGNADGSLWTMQNGYCQATSSGLAAINGIIAAASEEKMDHLRGLLEVGIHWDMEVTSASSTTASPLCISQIFCSALPVSYARRSVEKSEWKNFATLVLEAAYEATILGAIINREHTGCNKLCLTALGGGAFGNAEKWIFDSMQRALEKYSNFGLDICIVSYSKSNTHARRLETRR